MVCSFLDSGLLLSRKNGRLDFSWYQPPSYPHLIRHKLQPDYGSNEGADKEDTPEGGGLFENENARQHGTHRANAGPHSVSGANGQRFGGFNEQQHAG